MSNRKKYNAKLIRLEIMRKRRLKKKMRRKKILSGRRKEMLNKAQSSSVGRKAAPAQAQT